MEPELLELLDPLLPELLELLEPLDEDDEPLLTELAVAAAECVSPHAPRKTPIVATAAPVRRLRRAVRRSADERCFVPAAMGRGAATWRPALASVTSPSGCATQLKT